MKSRKQPSLDVPRQGYVLSTSSERFGAPIRRAVGVLRQNISPAEAAVAWEQFYACRKVEPGATNLRSKEELGAWAVVAAWIVGNATQSIPPNASLLDAEAWFLGQPTGQGIVCLASSEARIETERLLHSIVDVQAFSDLLPYILDPHGEGSRLSVVRRPETTKARDQKRAYGVYYTPGDVAAYMVSEVIRPLRNEVGVLTVFDPACGSGVFLRAAFRELARLNPDSDLLGLACSGLFGTDIDPWALDASAFVLLLESHASVKKHGIPPVHAWHALRLNLAHIDALRLDPVQMDSLDQERSDTLQHCRGELISGVLPSRFGEKPQTWPVPIQIIFPGLLEGPRVLIGNPPYAEVNGNSDHISLIKRFETFRAAPSPSSDLFPLFVEQMTRLVAPNAHGGAMVLPLSIACNSGKQFVSIRNLIGRTPGEWKFAFFDREPHALFGEDVKTRNAIVVWDKKGRNQNVEISTGPLRKWRGHSRARMLSGISFTPIEIDISPGVPKVEGKMQAVALGHLCEESSRLQHVVKRIGRATLHEAIHGSDSTVYVGATAYNFLNVFLRPPTLDLKEGASLTANPMHALVCPTREIALQVYAVLSSRLAFWWWHVHGDGFHVSRRIIETLPVGELMTDQNLTAELCDLGRSLWSRVSSNPTVSLNRGSTSLGFSAGAYDERICIDSLLVGALGLQTSFVDELGQFCEKMISAHINS